MGGLQFVNDPEHAVNAEPIGSGDAAELAVAGQQNAGMDFGRDMAKANRSRTEPDGGR